MHGILHGILLTVAKEFK